MREMPQPPATLRELFGTGTVCVACIAVAIVIPMGSLAAFVFLSSAIQGETDAALFALFEFAPVMVALSFVGLAITLAAYSLTASIRRIRRHSTAT